MIPKLSANIVNLIPSATEEVDNEIKQMKHAGVKDIISLGVGEPCYDTPIQSVRASQHALASGETRYQPTAGSFALREAVAHKLQHENRIKVSMEDVIITPGAKFAIYLMFQALVEPGDRVIVLDPAWVSHTAIPQMMGAEVVRVPTLASQGFHPDLDLIQQAFNHRTKCIIINSPCNPTGAVFEKNTIKQIMELAQQHGALVLSDEIYENLIFEGSHYSPASEYDNVVTVNGFSKTYAMTGWRLGYVTGPRELLEAMNKIYQHSASCVTAFAQAGALTALTDPLVQQEAQNMLAGYGKKREIMLSCLQDSKYFHCQKAEGAFYCFPSYYVPQKSMDLAKELLHEIHVATLPGSAFGECGENHLRLSYAAKEQDITEAMARIEEYIRNKYR